MIKKKKKSREKAPRRYADPLNERLRYALEKDSMPRDCEDDLCRCCIWGGQYVSELILLSSLCAYGCDEIACVHDHIRRRQIHCGHRLE